MDESTDGAVRRGEVLTLEQRSGRRRDYRLRRGDRDLGRLGFAPGRRSLAQAETDQTGALVLTAGRGRVEVRRRDGGAPVATVEGGRRPVMAIRTAQGPVYGWRRSGRVFLAFGATWGMPLLFVISGIGSWYSLGSRSAAEFARERLRRLGVPLLVGLLTLVPLQVYLGRRRAGDTSSYADFSARFWDVRPSLEFPFVVRADPAGGLFETGHLWFLVCLLGFSLVLLPGLVLLGRPPGRRLIERLAGLLARPGGLLLPVLPLAAVEVLRGSETGHGGWNDASYALFLVYGFLAAADPRIGQAFRRRCRAAMTLGGLLLVAAGGAFVAASPDGDPLIAMDLPAMGFRLLKSAAGWAWVVAILGLAGSRGARPGTPRPSAPVRRLGVSVNDAVPAFYVLLPVARYLFGLKPIRGTIDP